MTFVRLEDVIKRVHTKVDKDNTDLIYYVGGEHIESENIRVTKRGLIEGSTIGPMFYYGFKAGDFLLVSRNPHLKKAGVVNFDGICSEKTFVLATADKNKLLPEFLPFVLQNELFWDYAYQHRHGSTNTFINWSTLANYEFELPDLEIQKKLADVLWAMNETMDSYKELISATDELVKSQFIAMFGDPVINNKGWLSMPLKEVAPESKTTIPEQEKYWLLNLDMIESFSGKVIEKVMVTKTQMGPSVSPFDSTMVLYSKLRPYLNKVLIPEGVGYATTELVGLKPNEEILDRVFLFSILRSNEFVEYATRISDGTQMPRMPMRELRNFQCILPPIEMQKGYKKIVYQSDKSKFEIEQALSELISTYKRIIKENLG